MSDAAGPVLADALVNGRVEHGRGYIELRLAEPRVASAAKPGQFLHILCGGGPSGDGLRRYLRRPLSLFRIDAAAGEVAVLFRVQGDGTRWLASRSPGDRVNIIGPLGNGFPAPPAPLPPAPPARLSAAVTARPAGAPGTGAGNPSVPRYARQAFLIGGGVGIPPLLPLAERLASAGLAVRAFLGGRTAGDILAKADFERAGVEVEVATDDGSLGMRGVATALLEAALLEMAGAGPEAETCPADARCATIFACGPLAMLRAVKHLALRFDVPAYVSLEERMACGVGACLGCPVRVMEEGRGEPAEGLPGGPEGEASAVSRPVRYRRVCCDGPVFPAWQVVF